MPRKQSTTPIQSEVLPPETEAQELIAVTPDTASVILLDAQRFDEFYDKIKGQTDAFVADVTTPSGRKAVASMAFKVTKTKTAIDKAAMLLTADWREKTNTVNAARKTMTTRLDALSDEVRQPLTDWENAEKAREARKQAVIDAIGEIAAVSWDDDSEAIMRRINEIDQIAISDADFGDATDGMRAERERVRNTLSAAHAKAVAAEQAAAELERLKAAEAERLEKEREARELAEYKERVRIEAEKAEKAQREATERAEAQRLENERLAAERLETAKREAAEAAAKAERDRIAAEQAKRDAERQAEVDAANARAAEAEQKAAAERKRIDDEKAAADAKAAQEAAEQAKRDKDRAHRTAVMKAMKEAFMQHADMDEATAKRAVLALTGKHIPNTEVHF